MWFHPSSAAFLGLLILAGTGFNISSVCVSAVPSDYQSTWHPNMRDAVNNKLYQLATKGTSSNPTDPCGVPTGTDCGEENNITRSGLMWFTATGCRVASTSITYVNRDDSVTNANTGDIIPLTPNFKGEIVYFPSPSVTDCYFRGDADCAQDEFCMVERHERWGGWAMAPTGLPADDRCAMPYYGLDISKLDGQPLAALNKSIVEDYCGGVYCGEDGICRAFPGWINQVADSQGMPAPWRAARGQCVKYRKKGQSCYMMQDQNPFYYRPFIGTADPDFNEGGGLTRPFVCGPGFECKDIGDGINTCVNSNDVDQPMPLPRKKWETCDDDLTCAEGLVCTGKDLPILNNTCVVPRDPDLCYAGPWWSSADCPRTRTDERGEEPPCGGMTLASSQNALFAAMLLSPGEIATAGHCNYWKKGSYTTFNDTSSWPARFDKLREDIYNIFDTLWPKHLEGFEELISFPNIERNIFGVPFASSEECTAATSKTCAECKDSKSKICILHRQIAEAGVLTAQPNKVWSLIHWVMTNLKEVMSSEQVKASRAIAFILRDNFWCPDCRGFFDTGVLGALGYPPSSTNAADHEYYWNLGHNQASEHCASTRGSHPWIMQLAGQSSGRNTNSKYQNPFFLPYKQANLQWKQRLRNDNGECDAAPKGPCDDTTRKFRVQGLAEKIKCGSLKEMKKLGTIKKLCSRNRIRVYCPSVCKSRCK